MNNILSTYRQMTLEESRILEHNLVTPSFSTGKRSNIAHEVASTKVEKTSSQKGSARKIKATSVDKERLVLPSIELRCSIQLCNELRLSPRKGNNISKNERDRLVASVVKQTNTQSLQKIKNTSIQRKKKAETSPERHRKFKTRSTYKAKNSARQPIEVQTGRRQPDPFDQKLRKVTGWQTFQASTFKSYALKDLQLDGPLI